MKWLALRFPFWFLVLVFLIVLQFLIPYSLIAQGKDEETNNWQFTLTPYMLFPSLKGELGLGILKEDVDAGLNDILDHLKFGAMLNAETTNDKWIFVIDVLYMKLGTKELVPDTQINAEVRLDQLTMEISCMKRLVPWADLGVGLRFNSVGTDIQIEENQYFPSITIADRQNWLDPVITGKIRVPIDSRLKLGLHGDIGGFGLNSKITWQIHPFVGYSISKLIEAGVAWRWLGINYETDNGSDYFQYNMVINGPELALKFHF